MEFKLQNVSKALTSLIVDEQVFENDTKTYLKNKYIIYFINYYYFY